MVSPVRANAVNCVKGEIHNVLTVLRLNARWATKARFTTEIALQAESPLIRALKSLHAYLEAVDDLGDVDTVRYLEPFLAVVESPHTTGPMTGAALSSLHKFLLYGFMSTDSPRAREGIDRIARGISRFHFEETDPETDEVVLMKLLELSALCLRCEVGRLLRDSRCWEIFKTCHRITCQERVSSLLGNTAGNTLAHIVLMVFSRARQPHQQQQQQQPSSPQSPSNRLKLTAAATSTPSSTANGTTAGANAGRPVLSPIRSSSGGSSASVSDAAGTAPTASSAAAVAVAASGVVSDSSSDSYSGNGAGSEDSGDDGDEERDLPSSGNSHDTSQHHASSTLQQQQQQHSAAATGGYRRRKRRANNRIDGVTTGSKRNCNVLVEIMRFLSRLSNPRENTEETCILSLSLINIALEAGGIQLSQHQALVEVMQGDLCKHLLHSSQTEDLTILSLTLRVVFNLFNSIKEHLKVQLEVFLTSIHLRILEGSSAASHAPEQRELVLESLLEFCREPALMLDLYINYDCDVQCTNLFETVCNALARQALPSPAHTHPNALNRLALEGVLAVIESMARRCSGSNNSSGSNSSSTGSHAGISYSTTDVAHGEPLAFGQQPTVRRAVSYEDSLSSSFDDVTIAAAAAAAAAAGASSVQGDYDEQQHLLLVRAQATRSSSGGSAVHGIGSSESDSEIDGTAVGTQQHMWMEATRARTAEILHQRKRMKKRLTLAADKFNSDQKGWITYAQELTLLPVPVTAAAVARFLKGTMGVDKAVLGEYMSKGPVDKYPFNAEVLKEYTQLFSFDNTPFDQGLRNFLKEFRLPGEAQCIDRLMEAFAQEYYRQGKGHHPFVDADAAFILAFSVIMLNTDLHNPQIRDDKRMTKHAFVRNNRQINGGNDLPLAFLESIYDSIASNEIAVHRDHISSLQDGMTVDYNVHWDGILNRSTRVTSASFTPSTARKVLYSAGVHERDMFTSIAEAALQAVSAVFERTRDDVLLLKALHGFHSYGKICTYFNMIDPYNALLVSLFRYGGAYMQEAASGLHPPPYPQLLTTAGLPDASDIALVAPLAAHAHRHRGLLALKSALEQVRLQGRHVTTYAWSALTECVLALCDLRALPPSLSDVDDFSDAAGAPLPPSAFAKRCRNRASGSSRSASISSSSGSSGSGSNRGLLGSLSSFLWGGGESLSGVNSTASEGVAAAQTAAVAALSQVVLSCQLVQLFPASKDLPLRSVTSLLRALLGCRDPAAVGGNSSSSSDSSGSSSSGSSSSGGAGTTSSSSANFEAHAVLALELGARVILANRHRVDALWPLMHAHVERVLSNAGAVSRLPFLIERMAVTVLRSCIHMLDQPGAAAPLLGTLALLQRLPSDILHPLADRIAMGLLSLVQANAQHLDDAAERWTLVLTLLTLVAAAPGGRAAAWEAVAYMAERGPLTANNVRPIFQAIVRFMEGEFGVSERTHSQRVDRQWTAPALQSLSVFVLALAGDSSSTSSSSSSSNSSSDSGRGMLHGSTAAAPASATAAAANAAAAADTNNSPSLEGGDAPERTPTATATKSAGSTDAHAGAAAVPILTVAQVDSLWETSLRMAAPLVAHPEPVVSKAATTCVQQLLLQTSVTTPAAWHAVFMEVLLKLPVCQRVHRRGSTAAAESVAAVLSNSDSSLPAHSGSSSSSSSSSGSSSGEVPEDLCLRCCTLVSRALLLNLPLLSSMPTFNTVWLTLLALLGTNLSGSAPGAVIHETCQQIITNMIMVVAHAGVFEQWTQEAGKSRNLLDDTWKLVDPVCPAIKPLLGDGGRTRGAANRSSTSSSSNSETAINSSTNVDTANSSDNSAADNSVSGSEVALDGKIEELQHSETLGTSNNSSDDKPAMQAVVQ